MLFNNTHNIGARAYRESVTLIRQVSATDEYGMQSLTLPKGSGSGSGSGDASVIGTFPASVAMLSGYAKTNYYQTAEIEAYEVRMRYVADKFERIIWNGRVLTVTSCEDVGQRQRELKIICSNREVI
jgi:hypothetical protein